METIEVNRSAGIVTVTLNRPAKKNAANGQMWDELLETFRDIAASGNDRVMVLTGAGGEFCAGADLTGGGTGAPGRHQLRADAPRRRRRAGLHRLPIPTIAKVRGVAVGAGCNMALGCDLVVASDNARFSEIFARRGSVDRLRRSGCCRGSSACIGPRSWRCSPTSSTPPRPSASASSTGSLPDAEIDGSSHEWAARLAAGPPIALAMTKRMLDNSMQVTLEEALDDEGVAQTVNFGTADTLEAMKAFGEARAQVRRALTGSSASALSSVAS